jgi:hypothetical protein
MSWYTNLLSALIIVLAGEGGSVRLVSVGLVNTRVDGGKSCGYFRRVQLLR